jgi:hypothetical protein
MHSFNEQESASGSAMGTAAYGVVAARSILQDSGTVDGVRDDVLSTASFTDEVIVSSATLPIGTPVTVAVRFWVTGTTANTQSDSGRTDCLPSVQGQLSFSTSGGSSGGLSINPPVANPGTSNFGGYNTLQTTTVDTTVGDTLILSGTLSVDAYLAASPDMTVLATSCEGDFSNAAHVSLTAVDGAAVQLIGSGNAFNYTAPSPVPVHAELPLFLVLLGAGYLMVRGVRERSLGLRRSGPV